MSFVNLRYGLAACCAISFAAVLDFYSYLWQFSHRMFVVIIVLVLFCMFCSLKHFQVLGMLLLGVALGYNSRSWQAHIFQAALHETLVEQKSTSQALRTLVSFAETQLGNFVSEGWLGSSAVPTSFRKAKGWEIVATKSVQELGIFLFFEIGNHHSKKNLKGFLRLTIVICNKNPCHPGGDFNVSLLQFFSGCQWLSWVA